MDLSANLLKLGIKSLNELQSTVLEENINNIDLQILAPTGSGKTLAFLLPVVNKLKLGQKFTQALIIVPSRELALQIEQVIKTLTNQFKITCCYGGHAVRTELNNLKEAPQVLIGTPGRLAFHLREGSLDFENVQSLVLDEFDKSLSLGFEEDMSFLIEALSLDVQKILTSATILDKFPKFINTNNCKTINFLNQSQLKPQLHFKLVNTLPEEKAEVFFKLLCKLSGQSVLVFCNHREAVDRLGDFLIDYKVSHEIYHGGLEQDERERALIKFRNGSVNILLTTDLASRGLDIPDLDAIVHYQLPHTEDAFIHRNGRTARMQAEGTVYLIVADDEKCAYLQERIELEDLSSDYSLPKDSEWQTVYFGAGKKSKVNKIDLVGFIIKIGQVAKDDIGKIEVKDHCAYVALKRKDAAKICSKLDKQKIKGKRIKVLIAQ